MEEDKNFKKILEEVKHKACLKQKIYRNTLKTFKQFQLSAKGLIDELNKHEIDDSVEISYQEKGAFEFEIKIGGDILLIYMHTNVFGFDASHPLWKTGYLKEDSSRNYCGMINIYNFLADSFKYNRVNDIGYLIGRTFVNKENHFFVEGRRQLNFLFNDFINQKIERQSIVQILEQSILYSMGFDLTIPSYRNVASLSVGELMVESASTRIKTAKKMGYRFSFDDEN
jgi:hypothetical protein